MFSCQVVNDAVVTALVLLVKLVTLRLVVASVNRELAGKDVTDVSTITMACQEMDAKVTVLENYVTLIYRLKFVANCLLSFF